MYHASNSRNLSLPTFLLISLHLDIIVTDRGPGLNTICQMVKTLGQTSKKVVY